MDVSSQNSRWHGLNSDMEQARDVMIEEGLNVDFRVFPDQLYLKIGNNIVVIHDAAVMSEEAYISWLDQRKLKGEL